MEVIKYNDLINVQGGAVKTSIVVGIVGAVIFLIGVFDGIFRPYKCR